VSASFLAVNTLTTDNMATRTLEARFEHLTVNDENDPGDGSRMYQKKVRLAHCNGA
jgi:hypothetical protein